MTLFRPGLPPKEIVSADAYGGELNKQAIDAAHYTAQVEGTMKYTNPARAAFYEATGFIAFANTLAMLGAEEYPDPSQVVRYMEPIVATAQEKVEEAVEICGYSYFKRADLEIIKPLVPAMIMYRSMCLYGSHSYAKMLRLGYAANAKVGAVDAMRSLERIERELPRRIMIGAEHEAAVLGLLNNGSPIAHDAIALPAYVADNDNRQTDIVYITFSENGMEPLQYAQAKARRTDRNLKIAHQAVITSQDIGNSSVKQGYHGKTDNILKTGNQTPEAREHIANHYDRTLAKIEARSSRFPLAI